VNELVTFDESLKAAVKLFDSLPDLYELEKRLGKLEQMDLTDKYDHIHMGGVYIRQLNIPKGSLIIGKRHRRASCNMLLQGSLLIYSETGPPQVIEAPLVFESAPNVKKMGFAITDVVFANVHPTDKTDLDEIEREFIIPEEEFLRIEGGA
jgi:hypothetical protein